MEVVSHVLFEARRKIIAQLQTAVAERGKRGGGIEGEAIQGRIWEREMQMDYMCMSGK